MKKQIAKAIEKMNEESAKLTARMSELDYVFCTGNGSAELEKEYYAADDRIRELRRLVFEAGQPKRNICRHTQELVSANID